MGGAEGAVDVDAAGCLGASGSVSSSFNIGVEENESESEYGGEASR